MVKLQKINNTWFITDSIIMPYIGLPVLYNGIATKVEFLDVENDVCIVEVMGMLKNTSVKTVEVIVNKIEDVYIGVILQTVNRLEVIDEKGRSYVKYLKPEQEVELSFQDNERTLKVFVNEKNIPK